jgi:NADPH:quinone reductase-like Zn-dependent oxidoreductase
MFDRGREELRSSQSDCFQLVLAVEGKGIVEQGDRRTQFKPGDMVIYSSMEESTVAYPEALDIFAAALEACCHMRCCAAAV